MLPAIIAIVAVAFFIASYLGRPEVSNWPQERDRLPRLLAQRRRQILAAAEPIRFRENPRRKETR